MMTNQTIDFTATNVDEAISALEGAKKAVYVAGTSGTGLEPAASGYVGIEGDRDSRYELNLDIDDFQRHSDVLSDELSNLQARGTGEVYPRVAGEAVGESPAEAIECFEDNGLTVEIRVSSDPQVTPGTLVGYYTGEGIELEEGQGRSLVEMKEDLEG